MENHPYQGKLSILKSLTTLAERLRAVRIDRERIRDFCSQVSNSHLPHPRWDFYFVYPGLDEVGVDYFMLMNSLNFCYWGTPKWTVEYRGQLLDGAFAMFAALTRALEEGIPIYDGGWLAEISQSDLSRILRGRGEIPLFYQRFIILREVGRILREKFGGRFYHLVAQAEKSAVKLVRLLVENFPSFNDSAEWEGQRILFYKRAQLAPAMLFERWQGEGPGAFFDIGELTASADYKIPQVLRQLGILDYSPVLAKFIDSRRRIPPESREELEIRITTLVACELIREGLQDRFPGITSQTVDRLLWTAGQDKGGPERKPYHLTLTTAY
jgi:hypothetical protein